MTMNDLCRQINCKHITWSSGGEDSCTAWLECKLHKEVTDKNHCAKCRDQVPRSTKSKRVRNEYVTRKEG